MVSYYEEMPWPALPDEMVASLSHWGCSGSRAIPGIFRHPAFNFILTPRSLRDWVEQNLPIAINRQWMVALQRLDAGNAPFHTDTIREGSYNCVVHGDGALTHFKDDMEGPVAETVCYEKNKWYFHNGSIPHAVTGDIGKRVAVTVFKFQPDAAGNLLQTPRLIDAYRRDPDFYYV